MMAFGPKNQVAEWRKIYAHIRELSVGDTVNYDALSEVLGRSFNDEGAKRNPLERARRELEKEDRRTLAVVRNVGYRVVQAEEHMGLARTHQKRSYRQNVRAKERLDSANRAALSASQERRLDEMALGVAHILSEQRRLSRKVTRMERALGVRREEDSDDDED